MTTLYDDSKQRKKGFFGSLSFLLLMVLVLLIVFRFLNVFLLWQVTKMELNRQSEEVPHRYYHLGLSTHGQSKKNLGLYAALPGEQIVVVSYFNLMEPSIFLVSNPDGRRFLDLGRLAVLVEPGISKITLTCEDMVETERKGEKKSAYFGDSLFISLFRSTNRKQTADRPANAESPPPLSYVQNSMESSKFLKIPYLIYFYLPLLVIVLLSSVYGRGFYRAFLYYLGLFFLFDFSRVMVTIPFSWLFNLLEIELPHTVSLLMATALMLFFLVMAGIGFRFRKEMIKGLWPRFLMLFFILLPFFLRF